jgi:hypothetical protein
MGAPTLVIGDGPRGIGGGLANVVPAATEQRGWHPCIVHVLDTSPEKHQAQAQRLRKPIPDADTR